MYDANAIRGKVAAVQPDGRVVINVGSMQNVRERMEFIVVAGPPIEIFDPETKKSLGKMENERLRMTVDVVYPQFSVCRTSPTGPLTYSSIGPILSGYVKPGDDVKQWIKPTM